MTAPKWAEDEAREIHEASTVCSERHLVDDLICPVCLQQRIAAALVETGARGLAEKGQRISLTQEALADLTDKARAEGREAGLEEILAMIAEDRRIMRLGQAGTKDRRDEVERVLTGQELSIRALKSGAAKGK